MKVAECAIMFKVGAIPLHLSAIIKDDRAIIGLNEQNNLSVTFFKENPHETV